MGQFVWGSLVRVNRFGDSLRGRLGYVVGIEDGVVVVDVPNHGSCRFAPVDLRLLDEPALVGDAAKARWHLEAVAAGDVALVCDHCGVLIPVGPVLVHNEVGYSLHGFYEVEAFEEARLDRLRDVQSGASS